MIKLKTKLYAEVDGKNISHYTSYYTASLSYKLGKAVVTIHPDEFTAGSWTRNLESLLGLDPWSGPPTDFLWLDFGQRWGVNNMMALMREIVNMGK